MNILLFDGPEWNSLYPLTLNRSVSEISFGIFSLREKWENFIGKKLFVLNRGLSKNYSIKEKKDFYLFINPAFLPQKDLLEKILDLKKNELLLYKDQPIAYFHTNFEKISSLKKISFNFPLIHIKHPWDLFLYNDKAISLDLDFLKKKKKFIQISSTNTIINKENIFLEKGAKVEHCILNASDGPIYIGNEAEIVEGSLIRGPLALGKGAQIQMGTKIYGATSIGAYCKVGGEIRNSVIFSYSNKAHEGFLGNSIIGSWCNLGAGTTTSNLKNNYSKIKIWDLEKNQYHPTDLQFCGLVMGDHSKSAICTNFNTGTLVGACTNIFDKNLSKHIPSFRWGGNENSEIYDFKKACQGIQNMMNRRGKYLSEEEKKVLKHVFDTQVISSTSNC